MDSIHRRMPPNMVLLWFLLFILLNHSVANSAPKQHSPTEQDTTSLTSYLFDTDSHFSYSRRELWKSIFPESSDTVIPKKASNHQRNRKQTGVIHRVGTDNNTASSNETDVGVAADDGGPTEFSNCFPGILENTTETTLYDCNSFILTESQFTANPIKNVLCSNCSSAENPAECANNCCNLVDPGQLICRCPADRTGSRCQFSRRWSCDFTLVTHDLSCSSPTNRLNDVYYQYFTRYDGNTCDLLSIENPSVTFGFSTSCKMTEPLWVEGYFDPIRNEYTDGEFGYFYYRSNELAFTAIPEFSVGFKIFNHLRKSDITQVQNLLLLSKHYDQSSNLEFTINFKDLASYPKQSLIASSASPRDIAFQKRRKYIFGGRAYMELVLLSSPEGIQFPDEGDTNTRASAQRPLFRSFLDFYDIPIAQFFKSFFENNPSATLEDVYKEWIERDMKRQYNIMLGIVVSIAVVVGIGGAVAIWRELVRYGMKVHMKEKKIQ